MLLEAIIIQSSRAFQKERSISAIFHLLKGKASIQTVQDSQTYRLTAFYGIYPSLTKQTFEQIIHELIKHQYLSYVSNQQTGYPTKQGLHWFKDIKQALPLKHYQGFLYHKTDQIFYLRLLLMIQVLTNRLMNETSYIPIVDDPAILNWMKHVYPSLKHEPKRYLQALYEELTQCLEQCDEQAAHLFVDRITTYQHYGMSLDQLAHTYQIKRTDLPLWFTAIIHQILKQITAKKEAYPFLNQILTGLSVNGMMTQSAQKTYEWIQKQYSLAEIARIRRLKLSTIYDHLVEIALFDKQFSIRPYVSEQVQHEIIQAVKATKSFKLKTIKDHVSDDISYFQIRLTLAATDIELE